MSAITDLKNIIDNQVGDGRIRLSCVVESNPSQSKNIIMLFYTGAKTSPLALGQYNKTGYYIREVECAVRHQAKDKAEEIAFQTLKLLGINRRQTNLSLFLDDTPVYKGIDDTGGHVWSFLIKMRGKQ